MCTFIREIPKDLIHSSSNMFDMNFLYKEGNTYIMDNHRAAGWCWLQELDYGRTYNFMHIDHHGDLQECGIDAINDFMIRHPAPTFEEYIDEPYNFTYSMGRTWKLFGYSNYIKLMYHVRPNWFSECYFSTGNHEGGQPFDITNIEANNLSIEINDLLSESERQWIVNLDLDFFYNNDEDPNIYPVNNEYFNDIMHAIHRQKPNIAVLTIALSPECCGGWMNAIALLERANDQLELHFPQIDGF